MDVGGRIPGGLFPLLLGPKIIVKVFNVVKRSKLVGGSFLHSRFPSIQIEWMVGDRYCTW